MIRYLLLGLTLIVGPLFGDELDVKLLQKVGNLADEAGKLDFAGKTTKADRIQNEAISLVDQYIRDDIVYTLPEECAFFFHSRMIRFRCKELKYVAFFINRDDSNIAEQIEDCNRACTGEFQFVKDIPGGSDSTENKAHWVIRNLLRDDKVMLSVKFLSVKTVPVPKRKSSPKR